MSVDQLAGKETEQSRGKERGGNCLLHRWMHAFLPSAGRSLYLDNALQAPVQPVDLCEDLLEGLGITESDLPVWGPGMVSHLANLAHQRGASLFELAWLMMGDG
jgi:hypothetical protein